MQLRVVALVSTVLVLGACSRSRDVESTRSASSAACTGCHGGEDNDTGAPPRDAHGNRDTTARGVGAHTAHLEGSHGIAAPLACEACHAVPSKDDPAAHVNGTVSLPFAGIARANGVAAGWNGSDATCAVYCHGASLHGGAATRPVWTKADGSQVGCASCHGYAPPLPHPQRTDCHACHSATVLASGAIDLQGGHHIDGAVEIDGGACTVCHGTDGVNPAPPTGTGGESLTTQLAVGAHQKHVVDGSIRKALECVDCHAAVTDLTHVNGVVSLPFSGIASTAPASPIWNRSTATCSSTYCHGATLDAGGVATAPVWTAVSSGATACDSCHGSPPPYPHPQAGDCHRCHSGTVLASGAIDVAGGKHIDGTVQVDGGGCTACHGTEGKNPAPPSGTRGETLTSQLAVGAHQKHVLDGPIRKATSCSECHAPVSDLTHVNGTVAMSFGGVAATAPATPSWTRGTATCSSTYCHGATLDAGGAATAPVWTNVSSGATSCGSCHGSPPPFPHPQANDCHRCHSGTVLADGTIDVAAGKHIDGTLQVDGGGCTACHGTEGESPAPPAGTRGETATTELAVGAHRKHVTDGQIHGAFQCSVCHAPVADLSHVNGTVSMPFGGIAAAGSASPTWARATATCSSTYCHGATLDAGGAATAPVWTNVSSGATSCGACHGSPPPLPHPQNPDCHRCHSDTVLEGGGIDLTGGKHIDGTVDVNGGGCTLCHGTEGKNPAPPAGTRGETLTTDVAVGAHQKHVVDGTIHKAFLCSDCHAPVSDLTHIDGSVSLPFAGVASTAPAAPSWTAATATCNSTYCHGATLDAGGNATAPIWTSVSAGPTSCGACHGNPPPLPHPQNPDCSRCHPGTVLPTGAIDVVSGQHIDGTVQVKGGTCTACHGTENVNAAPPAGTRGETSTAQLAVGAHQKHVVDGALHRAYACGACHEPVTDLTHIDGVVALPFTGLASTAPATPSWDRAAATCSSTYCHGATIPGGGTNKTPVWTAGPSQAACGTCHGSPPDDGPMVGAYTAHRTHTYRVGLGCDTCHAGYKSASVDPALHVNGTRDVVVNHFECFSAGTPAWCDPATEPDCVCQPKTTVIEGWNCGGCHALFPPAY